MDEEIVKGGWIKIFRTMLEWEWYDDINVKIVFLHLLLKANFEDKKWKGINIKRGDLITSYGNLADELGLTSMQVRTAIQKLKSTNEITTKTTNKYTLITLLKYSNYQDFQIDNNKQDNRQNNFSNNNQITNEQQTNNNQITTTKEYKNIRNKELKKAAMAEAQKNIIEVVEQELPALSDIDKTKMQNDIKIFLNDIPEDMIIKAIREGGQYKAKSWNYVKAILNRCIQDGVKGKLEFDNKKSKNTKTGKYDDVYKN